MVLGRGDAPEALRGAEGSPAASSTEDGSAPGMERERERERTASGCVEERAADGGAWRGALKERGGRTGWHASSRLEMGRLWSLEVGRVEFGSD